MNTLLTILVHNRLENLRRWLHAWKQCDQTNTTLLVIHNYDEREPDPAFQELCIDCNYCPRRNNGFDIGAFQDLITGNLSLLLPCPNWDTLHWCVDDTLPLVKNFISVFRNLLYSENNVGIRYGYQQTMKNSPVGAVGVHISQEYKKHLRTNSFMIHRHIAERLQFPGTKVATKKDCYDFEHRGFEKNGRKEFNMLQQIERMNKVSTRKNYRVIQADNNIFRFFWDSGYYTERKDLEKSFQKMFETE